MMVLSFLKKKNKKKKKKKKKKKQFIEMVMTGMIFTLVKKKNHSSLSFDRFC